MIYGKLIGTFVLIDGVCEVVIWSDGWIRMMRFAMWFMSCVDGSEDSTVFLTSRTG